MDRPEGARRWFRRAEDAAEHGYGPVLSPAMAAYRYVLTLESEVERLRGQLHEMLVDPDNTVSSIYLRHEALRAKLERVRGMGEALADDDTRSGYGCGLAILEILDGEQDGA